MRMLHCTNAFSLKLGKAQQHFACSKQERHHKKYIFCHLPIFAVYCYHRFFDFLQSFEHLHFFDHGYLSCEKLIKRTSPILQ